jgi:SAM-dependent methyltransferase
MVMSATATTREIDLPAAQAFAMRMIGETTSILMGTLQLVGDRLGLFETLAASEPLTAEAFSIAAGIDGRYAREWLSAMACHGYVHYDGVKETFSLPPEHALVLAHRDSPLYVGGLIRTQPDFWANVDLLTESFKQGGGVSQDRFGEEWRCGFERFSRPGFVNNLAQHWIPAMPEVERRLRNGGSVADVGCGNGQAAIEMAKHYDQAKVFGFDVYPSAIETARENARAAGVEDRITFEVIDLAEGLPGSYDLVTAFDVVHDLPRPVEALREIRQALRPGGSLFVLEFNLSSDLQENIDHPLGMGAFGYAASVNYCMTTALAVDGIGTGTCMGERRFRELAAAAGFRTVNRLDFPTNPFNIFFEVKD